VVSVLDNTCNFDIIYFRKETVSHARIESVEPGATSPKDSVLSTNVPLAIKERE
jgi:hypothetical protein